MLKITRLALRQRKFYIAMLILKKLKNLMHANYFFETDAPSYTENGLVKEFLYG